MIVIDNVGLSEAEPPRRRRWVCLLLLRLLFHLRIGRRLHRTDAENPAGGSGFSTLVWLITVGQAANGLLVSVVMNHVAVCQLLCAGE